MILRRDHVAGGAFIVFAGFIWAVSGDLPFGTLASPGAGMLPMLLVALMALFGLMLLVQAHTSAPLASIDWSDFRHGLSVLIVACIAAAMYNPLGFLVTIPTMLFVLVFVLERQPLPRALTFSIGAAALAYGVFGVLLRSSLPTSPWGF